MKMQIRNGLFETNSSSVHSLVLARTNVFNKWVKGEVLFNPETEEFCAFENIPEKDKRRVYEAHEMEDIWDCPWLTYEEYFGRTELETFEEEGFGVTAFGYYGYDG